MDTIFKFLTTFTYESRKSHPGSLFWEDENEKYYPHSIGITTPYFRKSIFGILFHKLLKWHGTAEIIEGKSHLSDLSLGYCYLVSPKLNLGIAVNYVWGKYNASTPYCLVLFNTYGLGMITSFSLLLKPNTLLALRFMSPTFLRGKNSYQSQSPDTSFTYNIKDNIPWEINAGIKHNLIPFLTLTSQVTYKNWRRGMNGGFIWGNHEWQLHYGLELRPNNVFALRLGTFIQQFYSDLEIPFLKFQLKGRAKVLFLTGGIGIKTNILKADIGVGSSLFIEHTDPAFNFYSKRNLMLVSVTIFPEKLFKKHKGGAQ
ncbi:MAG: hypothetical protein ACUVTX_10585 [Bacteroidales bacterium]